MLKKVHIELIYFLHMSKCEAKKLMNTSNLNDKQGVL